MSEKISTSHEQSEYPSYYKMKHSDLVRAYEAAGGETMNHKRSGKIAIDRKTGQQIKREDMIRAIQLHDKEELMEMSRRGNEMFLSRDKAGLDDISDQIQNKIIEMQARFGLNEDQVNAYMEQVVDTVYANEDQRQSRTAQLTKLSSMVKTGVANSTASGQDTLQQKPTSAPTSKKHMSVGEAANKIIAAGGENGKIDLGELQHVMDGGDPYDRSTAPTPQSGVVQLDAALTRGFIDATKPKNPNSGEVNKKGERGLFKTALAYAAIVGVAVSSVFGGAKVASAESQSGPDKNPTSTGSTIEGVFDRQEFVFGQVESQNEVDQIHKYAEQLGVDVDSLKQFYSDYGITDEAPFTKAAEDAMRDGDAKHGIESEYSVNEAICTFYVEEGKTAEDCYKQVEMVAAHNPQVLAQLLAAMRDGLDMNSESYEAALNDILENLRQNPDDYEKQWADFFSADFLDKYDVELRNIDGTKARHTHYSEAGILHTGFIAQPGQMLVFTEKATGKEFKLRTVCGQITEDIRQFEFDGSGGTAEVPVTPTPFYPGIPTPPPTTPEQPITPPTTTEDDKILTLDVNNNPNRPWMGNQAGNITVDTSAAETTIAESSNPNENYTPSTDDGSTSLAPGATVDVQTANPDYNGSYDEMRAEQAADNGVITQDYNKNEADKGLVNNQAVNLD